MICAAILAGGIGSRLKQGKPKQFVNINNKPILVHSVEIFLSVDELGIDIEQLGDEVNIVIQVEGDDELESDFITDEDFILEPNEWYFDDDPYGIVYYEFPEE